MPLCSLRVLHPGRQQIGRGRQVRRRRTAKGDQPLHGADRTDQQPDHTGRVLRLQAAMCQRMPHPGPGGYSHATTSSDDSPAAHPPLVAMPSSRPPSQPNEAPRWQETADRPTAPRRRSPRPRQWHPGACPRAAGHRDPSRGRCAPGRAPSLCGPCRAGSHLGQASGGAGCSGHLGHGSGACRGSGAARWGCAVSGGPLPETDCEEYRALRKKGSSLPMAFGERVTSTAHAHRLLARCRPAAFTFDVAWCGGITEAMRLLSLAQAHDVPVHLHGRTFMPAVHLAAAFPRAAGAVEYQVMWEPRRVLSLTRFSRIVAASLCPTVPAWA
ncbi:enolase C-terminal domain-like protein [Streptomyces netropsis]|uniref:enolase C-terminal domain-like protein n=1 Tax=Streptomyces netropsis TaxID=55404 RepID=UPI0030CB4277